MRTKSYVPYLFLTPAIGLFAVFMVYPIIYSFLLSSRLAKAENWYQRVFPIIDDCSAMKYSIPRSKIHSSL